MNTLFGILLVAMGLGLILWRETKPDDKPAPKEPRHGSRRVVERYGHYDVEEWISFPTWKVVSEHLSEAEAKEKAIKWNISLEDVATRPTEERVRYTP